MSSHDRKDEVAGVVEEAMPNRQFKVKLNNGRTVRAYLGGKLAKNFIKVLIGDKVKVFCPPQGDICRITHRPNMF